MSQHTPGPWEVFEAEDPNGGKYRMPWVLGPDGKTVANTEGIDKTKEIGIANASLIAKAPEMYRLIKLSLQAGRFPEVGDGCAEVARALLREIGGEK